MSRAEMRVERLTRRRARRLSAYMAAESADDFMDAVSIGLPSRAARTSSCPTALQRWRKRSGNGLAA